MSFFLSRVFAFFVPRVCFFCPECLFFFVPNVCFFLSRMSIFCPECLFFLSRSRFLENDGDLQALIEFAGIIVRDFVPLPAELAPGNSSTLRSLTNPRPVHFIPQVKEASKGTHQCPCCTHWTTFVAYCRL